MGFKVRSSIPFMALSSRGSGTQSSITALLSCSFWTVVHSYSIIIILKSFVRCCQFLNIEQTRANLVLALLILGRLWNGRLASSDIVASSYVPLSGSIGL